MLRPVSSLFSISNSALIDFNVEFMMVVNDTELLFFSSKWRKKNILCCHRNHDTVYMNSVYVILKYMYLFLYQIISWYNVVHIRMVILYTYYPPVSVNLYLHEFCLS